jgi:hypothetical protein
VNEVFATSSVPDRGHLSRDSGKKKKEGIQDSFEFYRFRSMTRQEIPSGLWPTGQVRLTSACNHKCAKPSLYLGVVAALYKHTDPWVLEYEPSDPACGRQ